MFWESNFIKINLRPFLNIFLSVVFDLFNGKNMQMEKKSKS